MSTGSNVVRVNIFGQEYVIKTTADPQYIKEVAAYVNEKMIEIEESGIDATSQQLKIAVLASMNITDELFMRKKNQSNLINKIETKTLAITEFIDEKIEELETNK